MTTLFARGAASVPPLVLLLVMPVAAKPPVPEESLLLQDLINLPARDLAKVDIVTVNLACAEGLPGSETIDRKAVRDTLDRWARAISVVTVHDLKHFQEEPEVYDNSYEQFLVRVMLRCLVQHLGVHYNDEQKTNPSLAKSQDQFVHGLVNGTGGTCASLPTLFVAVGRRLGYPLKLVQSAHHYFARWDDPVTGVSFNIEAHQDGFGFYPDAR